MFQIVNRLVAFYDSHEKRAVFFYSNANKYLRNKTSSSSSSADYSPHCWGTGLPYGLHKRTAHNKPPGPVRIGKQSYL
jgi:hypothetical protein